MTDLRTAAQQALAFTMRDFASLRDFEAARAVLHDNLRAALAQQAEPVEPVAWRFKTDAWFDGNVWHDAYEVTTDKSVAEWRGRGCVTPLYTAPPQRKPEQPAPCPDCRGIGYDASGQLCACQENPSF